MHPQFRNYSSPTYVNDIITGPESEEAAFDLYNRARDIFRAGGFNLRKFVTSSLNLHLQINCAEGIQQPVQKLSYSDETYAKTTLGAPSVRDHKILGVSWNPRDNCLFFDVSDLAQLAYNLQPTKRNIVSLIGKFYDPLGFLVPVTIRFKIFFQKLCQTKMDWDSPLPDYLVKEWKELVSGGVPINMPRSYFNDVKEDPTPITLGGFCDASNHAYAAVVYRKAGTDTGASVKFVVSKTRVAPLQTQSIPHFELLSAFLLSKLIVSVTKSQGNSSEFGYSVLYQFTGHTLLDSWNSQRMEDLRPEQSMRSAEMYIQFFGTTLLGKLIQLTCHSKDSLCWSFLQTSCGRKDPSG